MSEQSRRIASEQRMRKHVTKRLKNSLKLTEALYEGRDSEHLDLEQLKCLAVVVGELKRALTY